MSSVEEKYWSALEISFELSKYNIKANTNEIGKLANENDMKNSKYGYVYVCVDDNGEKYEQFLYNKTGRNLLVSMYINARSPKNDVNEITYEKITDFTYISYKEKDNKWLAVIKYQKRNVYVGAYNEKENAKKACLLAHKKYYPKFKIVNP